MQDWTNTDLIQTDDDWSGVPGITGYRGDGLAPIADSDPQTIVADGSNTPFDVIANQTNSDTLTTGGVAEFDGIADPVVALQASGIASAPFLLFKLNTTGNTDIRVVYDLRDIDSSADNSVQQVALQYRIGSSGNFVNVPAGYVADASGGPNQAGLNTHVDAILPADANDQSLVQVRIITSNASGADEWIGVDNISITGSVPNNPPSCMIGKPQNSTDESGPQIVPDWIKDCSANDPGQTVTISVNVDTPELFTSLPAVDASGTLTYTPAPNMRGTTIVTVTVKDDGGTANGGIDTTFVMRPFNIDKPHPWRNAIQNLDVTGDHHVAADDAVGVINYIDAFGSGLLPARPTIAAPYYDVNGDGFIAANDVVEIINAINAGQGGEGESDNSIAATQLSFADLVTLLAFDTAQLNPRRQFV